MPEGNSASRPSARGCSAREREFVPLCMESGTIAWMCVGDGVKMSV